MPKWKVVQVDGKTLSVPANALRIEGGALIFDLDNSVVAYGPSAWFFVAKENN